MNRILTLQEEQEQFEERMEECELTQEDIDQATASTTKLGGVMVMEEEIDIIRTCDTCNRNDIETAIDPEGYAVCVNCEADILRREYR
jgi:hypothetical protein